jgi:hypothetical protein
LASAAEGRSSVAINIALRMALNNFERNFMNISRYVFQSFDAGTQLSAPDLEGMRTVRAESEL